MIDDGFTRFAQIGQYSFLYRPLTVHQLAALRKWSTLPRELYVHVVNMAISRQVVVADWEMSVPEEVLCDVFREITTPTRHEDNLYRAAVVAFGWPHLSRTSCASCMYWTYFPLSGKVLRDNQGHPVPRQASSVVPCRTSQGCPKGTAEDPIEFTPENRQAFEHYRRRCGNPADELMAMNWRILAKAEDDARRLRQYPQDHGGAVGGSRQRHELVGEHVRPQVVRRAQRAGDHAGG